MMNKTRSSLKSAFRQKPSNTCPFHRIISMVIAVLLLLSVCSTILIPVVLSKENPKVSEQRSGSDKEDTSTSTSPSLETSTSTASNPRSSSDQSSPTQTTTQTESNQDSSSDSSFQSNPTPSNQLSSTTSSSTEAESSVSNPSSSSPDLISHSTNNYSGNASSENISSTNQESSNLKSTNQSFLNPLSSGSSTDSENDQSQPAKSNSFIFKERETNDSSSENADKQYVSNIGKITKDQHVSVSLEQDEKDHKEQNQKTIIEKIEFKAASTQQNVELSVKNLKEKPIEIKTEMNTSQCSEIYEYLDIKLVSNQTYIGETGIQTMNFTFTINKSWIQSKNIDKKSVVLMRYHNDTWQSLNTNYVNETNKTVRFIADTPGLSIFAVVGDKVVEDSDEIIIESTSFPWWMPASVIFISTVSLGVVLVKKRFVYTP